MVSQHVLVCEEYEVVQLSIYYQMGGIFYVG